MNRDLPAQFSAVWNYFSTVRLPGKIFQTNYTDENLPPLMRPITPVFGAVLGLCAVIPLALLMPFGRVPVAIAGGLIVPYLLDWMTGFSGLSALSGFIENRYAGAPMDEAVSGIDAKPFAPSSITTLTLYLLRAVMFAVLCASGSIVWIMISLTGAYLVRAELAASDEKFFPAESRIRNLHWVTGGGLMLVEAFFHSWNILPALAAVGIAWLCGAGAARLCRESGAEISDNALSIFGFSAELLLLLLGVFVYVG